MIGKKIGNQTLDLEQELIEYTNGLAQIQTFRSRWSNLLLCLMNKGVQLSYPAIRYPPGDQFIGSGLMEPIFAPLQAS